MSIIKFTDNIPKTEGGVLARLWRNILRENNLLPKLDYLVLRYVRKTDLMTDRVQAVKRKHKFTLTKNLTDTEITFKTFLDLLFNLLEVKQVNFTVSLKFANGEKSVHTISVDSKATLPVSNIENTAQPSSEGEVLAKLANTLKDVQAEATDVY